MLQMEAPFPFAAHVQILREQGDEWSAPCQLEPVPG